MSTTKKRNGTTRKRRSSLDAGSVAAENKQLRLELKYALAGLKSFNDAFDAQPWATDEPARVQLDRITERLAQNDGRQPNTQGLVTPGTGLSPEEGAASRRHQ